MIRVNEGYELKQIVDDYIIVATGDKAVKFSAVLVLNEVGVKVFKFLLDKKSEKEIIRALVSDYNIDEATATADVLRFIGKLIDDGVCSRE